MSFTLTDSETAALQAFLLGHGHPLGKFGPRKDGVDAKGGDLTRAAFRNHFVANFRPEFPDVNADKFAIDSAGPTQRLFCADDSAAMIAYFGEPGSNQTRIELPYPVRLSWDLSTSLNSFYCHEKVADSLTRIFLRTLERYGFPAIQNLGLDRFGGCLNVRYKRGGNTWSTHAFGAAVDLWPERNQLNWDHSRAEFAKDVYLPFWDIVESEGWTSLGRARDFDWMHFQAPHL